MKENDIADILTSLWGKRFHVDGEIISGIKTP